MSCLYTKYYSRICAHKYVGGGGYVGFKVLSKNDLTCAWGEPWDVLHLF